MTRIGHQQLSQQNRTGVINYTRTIEYLVLYNNNPVPLYIRLGSPELPTQRNYDIAVPPNYIMGISVDSNQFGFRLGDDNVSVALITGITVIEGMIDEPPPALGGVPIVGASLATADLNNGYQQFSGSTIFGAFNLTLWGGMLITLFPDAGSGQGGIVITVSSDNVNYQTYATYAFWPSIPVSLLLPRIGVFVRIQVVPTTIVGEPVISGKIAIRGTLAELTQASYNPQSNAIVKNWAIAASGSQQFSFVTVGLPAVSIAGIATAGSGAGAIAQLLVEASSDNVNWRQVTQRRQYMSTGITLYRSFGNLDIFIRVTIFELSGSNASNGALYLSIQPEPDMAGILNNIYRTLGDTNNPNPIGAYEDIYHELDAIRLSDANSAASLNTILTNLGTVISNQGTMITTLGTINGHDANIDTQTVVLGTINTHLTNIDNQTLTPHQAQTRSENLFAITQAIAGPSGGWVLVANGGLAGQAFISGVSVSMKMGGVAFADTLMGVAIGTAIGAALALILHYAPGIPAINTAYFLTQHFGSIRSPGIAVGTFTSVYIQHNGAAGGTMQVQIEITT